jgi:hypothetical protein
MSEELPANVTFSRPAGVPSRGSVHNGSTPMQTHLLAALVLGRQIPEAPLAEPRRQPCAGTVERAALILPGANLPLVEHVDCPLHVARVPLRTDLIQTDLRKDEVKARTLVHQEGQPEGVEPSRSLRDAIELECDAFLTMEEACAAGRAPPRRA